MQSKQYKRTLCNKKGALAEPVLANQGKYYKFCALCGYQMIGYEERLKNHCKVYHEEENEGFLKFEKMPPKPIYKNFQEYLEGSAENLVFDPLRKENKQGRPKDSKNVDKLIESFKNKFKPVTDNDEKIQKEKESNTNIQDGSISQHAVNDQDNTRNHMKKLKRNAYQIQHKQKKRLEKQLRKRVSDVSDLQKDLSKQIVDRIQAESSAYRKEQALKKNNKRVKFFKQENEKLHDRMKKKTLTITNEAEKQRQLRTQVEKLKVELKQTTLCAKCMDPMEKGTLYQSLNSYRQQIQKLQQLLEDQNVIGKKLEAENNHLALSQDAIKFNAHIRTYATKNAQLSQELDGAKKFIFTQNDMDDVKKSHEKQLEKVWLQYIDKLPEGLKQEILSFQRGTEMTSMSLAEQEQLLKERDTQKNVYELMVKQYKILENKSAKERTELELEIDELKIKLEKYSEHDAEVAKLNQDIIEKDRQIEFDQAYKNILETSMDKELSRFNFSSREFLSKGAFSVVFKVKHQTRGFEALKIDYQDGQCIKNEMEVFKKLHCPFANLQNTNNRYLLKPTRDFTNFLNHLAYATPYYETSLTQLLNEKEKQREAWAQKFAKGLCLGLCHIHSMKMAHMDIKPDNIMVDENEDPVIIDFGVCGTIHPRNGTPLFHSPEQLAWKQNDPVPFNPLKFDSWQLGMVMFLCLGGSIDHPFFEPSYRERALHGKMFSHRLFGISSQAQDFVKKLLTIDHYKRPLVQDMLSHPWFDVEFHQPKNAISQEQTHLKSQAKESKPIDLSLKGIINGKLNFHSSELNEETIKQQDGEKEQQANEEEAPFDNKNYWNGLPWDSEAVCGSPAHQAKCSEKWIKVLETHDIFNRDSKNKHMLDLCCGWGRMFFEVSLPRRYKFKSYTGVDFSQPNASEFNDRKEKFIASKCEADIRFVHQDILEFKTQETKYDLITCCWCLGFFDNLQAMQILKKVHQALQIGGHAFFKESVNPYDDIPSKTRHGYTCRTKKQIEGLFEDAGFEYNEEDELVFQEGDQSYNPEVYWKLKLKGKERSFSGLEDVDCGGQIFSEIEDPQMKQAMEISMLEQQRKEEAYDHDIDLVNKRIMNLYGLEIQDIIGDGNCFYSSVAYGLTGSVQIAGKLRKEAVNYMRGHRDTFKENANAEFPHLDFNQYLEHQAKPGVWAGEPEIIAIMMSQKVHIFIHQKETTREIKYEYGDVNTPVIHLSYHRFDHLEKGNGYQGNHYNACRKLGQPEPARRRRPQQKPSSKKMAENAPQKSTGN